jgi:hypothetical protein
MRYFANFRSWRLNNLAARTAFSLIPTTSVGVNGEALASFAKGVWKAICDFSIDLLNAGEIEPGIVAHHWLIRGTSSGQEFLFKGAAIIQVEGDKIDSLGRMLF